MLSCMAATTEAGTAADGRRTAAERREHVIAAAVTEFARNGYNGASTAAIARRAGISQPYIYALFPSKRDLFIAACSHVSENVRRRFAGAVQGATDPRERLELMAASNGREEVAFQLQAYAAALDPEIRREVRRCFVELFDEVESATGASREDVVRFMSAGALLNVAAALDLPERYSR
jgi:AcrR family transcriptional regulator